MPHQHHGKHLHVRAQNMQLQPRQEPATVVQVVYKTAAKTFDGPIGGYKTLDGSEDIGNTNPQVAAPAPQTQAAPSPSPKEETTPVVQAPETPTPQAVQTPTSPAVDIEPSPQPQPTEPKATPTQQIQTPSSEPTAIVLPSKAETSAPKAAPSTTSLIKAKQTRASTQSSVDAESISSQIKASPTQDATDSPTTSAQIASTSAPALATSTASSSVSESSSGSNSGGMSGGAKAGLAIGILLAIGLLAALGFFCYRRKKKQQDEAYMKTDDEKSAIGGNAAILGRAPSTQSRRTTSTAPRLSLRPVTEFLPNLPGNRKSGNLLAPAGGIVEKKATQNQANNPANPFGNHAEPSENAMAPRAEKAMIPNGANPVNPFGIHAEMIEQPTTRDRSPSTGTAVPAPLRVRTPTPEGGAPAASTAALVAAGMAGAKGAPKPLNLSSSRPVSPAPMPSPAGTEFSMTSIGPAAMANGPAPSNVHRVQLDFKPSMDDELSLRAGQLVRLIHEYDDGWALCIRLDRSQQGVAPRTCLSARPVKPRPNPNARGPPPRGPPPPGMFGPGQQRPMSPSSGRGSPSPYDRAPRSMAPGARPAQRSMSPGPYGGGPQQRPGIPPAGGRRRSNSASDVRERRNSPPGPSPMNPNAHNIMAGVQRVPLQLQAVTAPDQTIPMSTSPPASMPARKPVPGQAM
ncbi:MAG: hypothetical protein Q9190_003370 [Brigantiaea leucoxantha]